MERHLLEWLDRQRAMRFSGYSDRPLPSWPRPAALDHRQHVRVLIGPESLQALRTELPKWLLGRPERQPYKPEIIAEEKAEVSDGIWVTLALNDINVAFGLGRNLGHHGQKGARDDA